MSGSGRQIRTGRVRRRARDGLRRPVAAAVVVRRFRGLPAECGRLQPYRPRQLLRCGAGRLTAFLLAGRSEKWSWRQVYPPLTEARNEIQVCLARACLAPSKSVEGIEPYGFAIFAIGSTPRNCIATPTAKE